MTCDCVLAAKTSVLLPAAFALGYREGLADAVGGRDCRPLTMEQAKTAIKRDCRCRMARRAPKHIARAHRAGYLAGFDNLLPVERSHDEASNVLYLEDARRTRLTGIDPRQL